MSAFGRKLRSLEGGLMGFWCPGCEMMHAPGVEPPASTIWGFNHNPDAPTFTPSVLVRYPQWVPPVTPENMAEYNRAPWPQTQVESVCHSFVTNGQIQFLSDCTHELAGQTVPLPDFPGNDQELS
jgi:hypothetical protein